MCKTESCSFLWTFLERRNYMLQSEVWEDSRIAPFQDKLWGIAPRNYPKFNVEICAFLCILERLKTTLPGSVVCIVIALKICIPPRWFITKHFFIFIIINNKLRAKLSQQLVSEMTYYASSGTLNPTHSLKPAAKIKCVGQQWTMNVFCSYYVCLLGSLNMYCNSRDAIVIRRCRAISFYHGAE